MTKNNKEVELECKLCYKSLGIFEAKAIPKVIKCPHCNIGQTTSGCNCIGYSHKRNYPEGFFR